MSIHARSCLLVLFVAACGSPKPLADAGCRARDVGPSPAGEAGVGGAVGAAGHAADGPTAEDAPPRAASAPDLPPNDWALVEVKGGLHADLDQAIGTNSAGDRSVGDRIRILAGEGSTDYVYLGHVGRFGQVPGGTGDVIAFVGHSMDSGDPSRPPDPDYAPARALFDALANGPRTGDDQFGTRTSPGGRVTCEVGVGSPYEASCRITGAIETFFR